MDKIKVLIFTNSFRIGGSEGQAVQLLRHLDRSRFDLWLACFGREGPLLEHLPTDLRGVEVFPVNGFATAGAAYQARRFVGLLRRSGVHLVQSFDFYTNVFGIPSACLAGVPVVIGSRRDSLKRPFAQRQVENWCLRMATGVVANAEALQTQLVDDCGLKPDRIWVIRNGLDLTRLSSNRGGRVNDSPTDCREITIAVVANLRPEKGHLTFLRAAQRIASRHPNTRFILIGDGPMRQTIEQTIHETGLHGRVRLMGAVKDVPSALQDIDIVVAPGEAEGIPNAVMEAMAASKAIVATDSGGTGEVVVEGVTGFLAPMRDADIMADRISRLCTDVELRRTMGQSGRQRIEQLFTAQTMARNFEMLYRELVEGRLK